jgi:hypothetical protein
VGGGGQNPRGRPGGNGGGGGGYGWVAFFLLSPIRTVTGLSARTFGKDMNGLVVDALSVSLVCVHTA